MDHSHAISTQHNPLFIIPARGGSKGIPKKNIRELCGKPLIYYTIDVARKLSADDDICVSTDSPEFKKVVEQYGLRVPFLRPEVISRDYSSPRETILHALDFYESRGQIFDMVVLLQPTSPLRKVEDVLAALNIFTHDIDMVVSVTETKANPYFVLFEEDADGFIHKSKQGHFINRQECPKVWELNGAVYVISVRSIRQKDLTDFDKIRKIVMEKIHSVDIDTEYDWKLAEFLLQSGMIS